jgi:hypothetical protein
MVSNRWMASIYNREDAAFASLLLALCTELQALKFCMTKKGRTPPRYTTRWIFGLTYVNDPSYDDDVDVYDGFQSIFLPHFFTMSGVTSLNVLGGNLETLDVGFKNLTTLDMDIFERRDDHYRNVCPTSGPVEEAPALQTLIIRCDCQALESQQDESVVKDSDLNNSILGQDVTAFRRDISQDQLSAARKALHRRAEPKPSARPCRKHWRV